MLRRENEHLCSKLDTVTAHLRAAHDPTASEMADLLTPADRPSGPPSLPINTQPAKVGKVAKGREVLLVFEGDLETCDRFVWFGEPPLLVLMPVKYSSFSCFKICISWLCDPTVSSS